VPLIAEVLTLALIAANLLAVTCLFLTLESFPIPLLGRVSLRRRSRQLLGEDHRWDLLRRRAREIGRRYPLLRILPFLVLTGCVFLPDLVPLLPRPRGTFASEQESSEFLATMWQVVAGALGLSVAMIAFAFEAFVSVSQRRLGGSLREFAADTWLLFVVQLGVCALLLNGFVLLGYGSEAPGGWAAMWATGLSASTLLGVVYVLNRVVKSLDFDELVRIRRRRLQISVEEAMWHQLTAQVAEAVLRSYGEAGVERLLTAGKGDTVVRSGKAGQVRDVRLGTLLRLTRRAQGENRTPSVGLVVELGRQVEEGDELISLRPTASWLERVRAGRAVRIWRRREAAPDRSLNDDLSRLHGQAIAAARAGRSDEWRPIGDLYEMVLLALPEMAKRIGVPYEGAIAAPGFFGFGPLQRIASHVADELEAALGAEDPELTGAIAYLPNKVVREVMDAEAVQVAEEMVKTFPQMYWLAMRESQPRSRAAVVLLDRSTSHLFDIDYLVASPIEEEPQGSKRREEAARLGRAIFRALNLILKSMIDGADQKGFAETSRRWAKMFEHEVAYNYEPPDHEPPADSFGSLDRYRRVLQFGLAMWAVHLLAPELGGGAPGSRERVEAVSLLSNQLGSMEELFDTFERATERDEEDSVPWSTWFLSELPSDEIHSIPTSSALMLTLILLALERVKPNGKGELKPREWFESRKSEIDEALARLRVEAGPWSQAMELVAPSVEPHAGERQRSWVAKLERLQAMLKTAREEAIEHRKAAEREAPLDAALAEEFTANLTQASREGRLLRDVFAVQGALRTSTELGETTPRTHRTWLPKRLFIRGSRLLGANTSGRELGRRTMNLEMSHLMNALEPLQCDASNESLHDQMSAVITELAAEERPATLVLLPVSWRLRENLGLTMWGKQKIESDLVPTHRSEEFAGLINGVPVLDVPWTPDDRIYLVNLPSLATYLEGPSQRNSGLTVELQSFDAEEARDFLADHPEVKEEGASDEETRLLLQERVLCNLVREWRLEPGDDPAARCVIVPENLRHKASG
jgi:hypothetical protein